MAREEKHTLTREDLKHANCEMLADELISRLNIDERDARELKHKLMMAAGYKSRREYYAEERDDGKRGFFVEEETEDDDDDL